MKKGGKEMASNGESRGGLLTAGGVLSIIGGLLELIGGGVVMGTGVMGIGGPFWFIPEIPWFPGKEIVANVIPAVIIIVGIVILALGAIGVAGGMELYVYFQQRFWGYWQSFLSPYQRGNSRQQVRCRICKRTKALLLRLGAFEITSCNPLMPS